MISAPVVPYYVQPLSDPVLVEAPKVMPVTLAMVKQQGRVQHDSEDDLVELYLAAATQYLDEPDGILGKVLVTQTWRQDYAGFSSPLLLPLRPVQSVTAIKYWDADEVEQVLDPSVYQLVTIARCSQVILAEGQTWPATTARADAVGVTFVAGYGDPPDLPAMARVAVAVLAAEMFKHRELSADKVWHELPMSFTNMITNIRTMVV